MKRVICISQTRREITTNTAMRLLSEGQVYKVVDIVSTVRGEFYRLAEFDTLCGSVPLFHSNLFLACSNLDETTLTNRNQNTAQ